MESFLTNHEMALAFDNRMDPFLPVDTGIPQGSPASPILFLIYIQPLFVERVGIHGLWTPSFMDDIALVVQGRSAVWNARHLEEAAKVAFEWAEHHCVAFDDGKTELIHFHKHHTLKEPDTDAPPRPPHRDRLALEKATLPHGTVVSQPADDEAVRWLGIWFDRRLNFKYHIRNRAKAGQRAWSAIRSLANTERGVGPKPMRALYLACIVPVMTYGAEIWWRGKDSDTVPL
jgi:hypothetical protein